MRSQKRLGEILKDKGLITDEQLEEGLCQQRTSREFIGEILIRKGFVSEKVLLAALSEQFNMAVLEIKDTYIDWSLVSKFSPSLILDSRCFPVRKDMWSVTMAITDPLDVWTIKKAEEESRPLKLKLVLTSPEDMREALQRYKQHLKGSIYRI